MENGTNDNVERIENARRNLAQLRRDLRTVISTRRETRRHIMEQIEFWENLLDELIGGDKTIEQN